MKKILLVEDDKFLSTLLSNRLRTEGFEVVNAYDGGVALETLSKDKFDLVLLDIILPVKSGFEVLETIKDNPIYGEPKIIIASNLGQEGDLEKGKNLGAVDYIVKGETTIDEILLKIKTFLS